MNFKKIFFALIVTTLLIGSACAANVNDFRVDGYNSFGWKGIIVALIVISGTYLGSATIANITLFLTGMI